MGGYANYYVRAKQDYSKAKASLRRTPLFEPHIPGSEHEFRHVKSGGRINIILDQS